VARHAVLACLASLLLITGCQPEEYAILISATSQRDDMDTVVETVKVTVVPLDTRGSYPSGDFRVARTGAAIAEDPIRIAIGLPGPRDVMVHISALDQSGNRMIATRCYPVTTVITDEVLLVESDLLDADRDGWLSDPLASCFDADGTQCRPTYRCALEEDRDCNDDPAAGGAAQSPGTREVCEDGLDQDCWAGDAACADQDGDGATACGAVATPGCDCDDTNQGIHPGADEICGDTIDQDCDGRDAPCDNDGDTYPSDIDCDDTDSAIHPGAEETCNGVDDDCNGLVDEVIECADDDLDDDGVPGCWHPSHRDAPGCDCNDCDRGVRPGAFDRCGNDVDEDCSGGPMSCDDDAACMPGDADTDGVVGTAAGGSDCDDTNAEVYPGAPERCGDGVDQDCDGADAPCAGDTDGDGWIEPTACAMNDAVDPGRIETCNGVDDDCDGVIDEVMGAPLGGCDFRHGEQGCISDPAMCADAACTVDFRTNLFNCRECGLRCDTDVANVCIDGNCMCDHGPSPEACDTSYQYCCVGIGCQDVLSSLDHCSGCNMRCNPASRPANRPLASLCSSGVCRCGGSEPCADVATQACCSNGGAESASCINPENSYDHCGGCNQSSDRPHATTECVAGGVVIVRCDPGWDDCDGAAINGCETDLNTLANCGGCGNVCSLANAVEECPSGDCAIRICEPGWGDCNGGASNGCETPLDTLTNCGACGTGCALPNGSESCATGSCRVVTCDPGWGNCNGTHADGCEQRLNTLAHCGACGTICARANASETCSTGSCRIDTCDGGWGDCNGGDSDGCEVNTQSTAAHCGMCGSGCPTPPNATRRCSSGSCTYDCISDYHDCSGNCVSDDDVATCGNRCSPCPGDPNGAPTCVGEMCGIMCDTDYHLCSGTCVSDDSTATCGSRCAPCPSDPNGSPTCMGSPEVCGTTCDSGYHDCSGTCVSNTSVATCGTSCSPCPIPAGSIATCSSGTCGFTCLAGFADCDTDPGNGCEVTLATGVMSGGVREHCGACNNTCGVGESCTAGQCCCGASCGSSGQVCGGSRDCCGDPLACNMGC
jgi:hypothetical protein